MKYDAQKSDNAATIRNIIFFINMLHMHPMDLESMTLPFCIINLSLSVLSLVYFAQNQSQTPKKKWRGKLMASIKSSTHQEWILYTYKLGGSPISNVLHWTLNAEWSGGLGWKSLISVMLHQSLKIIEIWARVLALWWTGKGKIRINRNCIRIILLHTVCTYTLCATTEIMTLSHNFKLETIFVVCMQSV